MPPGDAPALAAALGELLSSPDVRRAMGDHNRRVVGERYAWERVVERLEDAYREAIGLARPARTHPSNTPSPVGEEPAVA